MKTPIRIAALVLFALLLLAGCGAEPDGEIVSATCAAGASGSSAGYSYTLEEREDGVFFSCDADGAEGKRITLNDVPVEGVVMQSFRSMAESSGLSSSVIAYRSGVSASDESGAAVTLKWKNGVKKTSRGMLDGTVETLRFFRSVAEFASREPTSVPDGQLLSYSVSVFSAADGGSYDFSVAESGGQVLLSGSFTDTVQAADGHWEAKRIAVEDAPLSEEEWARIRDAAAQAELGKRLAAANDRWNIVEAAPDGGVIYDITARWEFGVALSDSGVGEPEKDALYEALTDAMRRAAQQN